MKPFRVLSLFVGLALSFTFVFSSFAQMTPPPPDPPKPAVEAPKPAPTIWSIDGEIRLRAEHRDDYDLKDSVDDEDSFVLSRVRLGVKVRPVENLLGYVQLQDSRLFGSEVSTASNEKNVDLHQGYLKIEKLWGDLSIQAGRFEMIYGDERLIGAFGWNNVGRAFDGVRVSAFSGTLGEAHLFATKLRESPSRKGDEEDLDFQGLYWVGKANGSIPALDAYLLRLGDNRGAAGELPDHKGDTNILTYGARMAGKWSGFETKLEAAAQSGDRNGDDHSAWAASLYAQQAIPLGSLSGFVGVGWAAASGDDGADGDSHEFENLFHTNHLHYGYIDMIGWRNLNNPWIRFFAKAGPVAIQLDAHRLSLMEAKGAWKDAFGNPMGRDATGKSGTHVGDEIDLLVTVPVYEKLKAQLGIARFWPGEFAEKVRGKDVEDWAYLMLSMPF